MLRWIVNIEDVLIDYLVLENGFLFDEDIDNLMQMDSLTNITQWFLREIHENLSTDIDISYHNLMYKIATCMSAYNTWDSLDDAKFLKKIDEETYNHILIDAIFNSPQYGKYIKPISYSDRSAFDQLVRESTELALAMMQVTDEDIMQDLVNQNVRLGGYMEEYQYRSEFRMRGRLIL